jgi:hypothetical protein
MLVMVDDPLAHVRGAAAQVNALEDAREQLSEAVIAALKAGQRPADVVDAAQGAADRDTVRRWARKAGIPPAARGGGRRPRRTLPMSQAPDRRMGDTGANGGARPAASPDTGGEPATPAAASTAELAAGPVAGPGPGGGDGGGRRRPSVFGREVERPEPVDADTARLEREPGSSRWRVLAGLVADPGTVVVVGVLEPVYGTGRRAVRCWEAYHGHVQVPGGPWRTRRDAAAHLLLQHERLTGL